MFNHAFLQEELAFDHFDRAVVFCEASNLESVVTYIRIFFLTMLCIMWLGLLLKTCTSALCILWMLMTRKQVCCLAVYFSGFLGLWIPLYIDDIGINLFIQAHLWKIHVCCKDLSLQMHFGHYVNTSHQVLVKGCDFKIFFQNGFIHLPKQKWRKTFG